MGDGLKPSPYYQGKPEETRTLGEYVSELCAYYMALGMPRDEFMNGGDYDATDDYEKAFECKIINENKMRHLQGIYNFRAFACVLSNAFAPKGSKPEKYFEYPLPITDAERKAEKERKIMHTLNVVRNRTRG